jgi:hypothetical protein
MMPPRPAVSVLLTSYNRAKFIRASIESVLQQTFTDFELLIVDDCSTDNTCEIAREYERDSRVRVLRNDRNHGQFANRNHAAQLARADLMKFHDSDDVMYPHCLDVMVSMMLAEPRAGFGLSLGAAWSGGPCPMLLTPRMSTCANTGDGMFSSGPAGAIAAEFRRLGGLKTSACRQTRCWIRAATEHMLLRQTCSVSPASGAGIPARRRSAYAKVARWFWRRSSPDCPLSPDERAGETQSRLPSHKRRSRTSSRSMGLRSSSRALEHEHYDWIRYLASNRVAFASTRSRKTASSSRRLGCRRLGAASA